MTNQHQQLELTFDSALEDAAETPALADLKALCQQRIGERQTKPTCCTRHQRPHSLSSRIRVNMEPQP